MFNTSRNKVSSPSVKAMQICPRIKWKVLDFKAWQLARQIEIYWGLKGRVSLMLDSCLIDKLSTEIYKNQFFRFDFTPICVYLFRLSFLTTLNIYEDYFKGCHSWSNLMQRFFKSILWLETYALIHLSHEEVAAFERCRVL